MTSQRLDKVDAEAMDRRADELVEQTIARGEHLWIALIAFRVVDPRGGLLLLDRENALYYPQVGCYVCEEPYSDRLATRRCKGDPR